MINRIAKELRNSVNWDIDSKWNINKKNLSLETNKLFLNIRKNHLLKTYYYFPNEISRIVPLETILKQVCSNLEKVPTLHSALKSLAQFAQQKAEIVFKGFPEIPTNFREFFSNNTSNLIYFCYVTFPATFGYFTFPEGCSAAFDFLKYFIDTKEFDNCLSMLCSGYFIGLPFFTDELCAHFFKLCHEELLIQNSLTLSDIQVFKIFDKTVSYASRLLTTSHKRIITMLYNYNQSFTINMLIKGVLYPAFNAEFNNDVLCKYTDTYIPLKNIFEQMIMKPMGPSAKLFIKRLTTGDSRSLLFEIYEGMTGLEFRYYPAYLSLYEVQYFTKLLPNDSQSANIYNLIKENFSDQSVFDTRCLQLYIFPVDKRCNPESLFYNYEPVKIKFVNENFFRSYNILNYLTKENIIDGFDLIQDPSKINDIVDNLHRSTLQKFNIITDINFNTYANVVYMNNYLSSLSRLDQTIIFLHGLDEVENFHYICQNYTNKLFKMILQNHDITHPSLKFLFTLTHIPTEINEINEARITLSLRLSEKLCAYSTIDKSIKLPIFISHIARTSLRCTHAENMVIFTDVLHQMNYLLKYDEKKLISAILTYFPHDCIPLLITCALYYIKHVKPLKMTNDKYYIEATKDWDFIDNIIYNYRNSNFEFDQKYNYYMTVFNQ